MNLAWYFAGMVTPPLIGALGLFIQWSFQKTTGIGGCVVPWCNRRSYERGEHYNIVVKLAGLKHQYLVGPRHRREVLAFWQDKKDRGLGVHPQALRKLK